MSGNNSRNYNGPYSIGQLQWPGLSKVLEETSELNEVLGKLMGSGGDTNHWKGDLREKMIEEIADVKAAIYFFLDSNFSNEEQLRVYDRAAKKVSRFNKWHEEGLEYNG